MKRERMRARGHRGTRGLVEMVRDQVKVLVESNGKVAKAVEALRGNVDGLGAAVELQGKDILALGDLMEVFAQNVDNHESRIAKLEKRGGGR